MTPRQHAEAIHAANPTLGRYKLAELAGCTLAMARRVLKAAGKQSDCGAGKPIAGPKSDTVSEDYKTNTGEVSVNSLRVISLDDALKVANVDLSQWEVERYTINAWEVSIKRADGVEQATNHQVKVWLKRLTPAMVGFARLVDSSFTRPSCQKDHCVIPANKDPHMLEISLMDHHFGKLAWKPETGSDYDLKIAATLYKNAVRDLVAKAQTFGVEEILLPIGQDFFNIDNNAGMTTGGTPQDCDSRLAKIFEVGCRAVLDAIDMCTQVAKVKIIWVPGNHDRHTSYYLCQYIAAWYRDCERVSIDVSPTIRKYVTYGVNLLGFTHGDTGKLDSLPLLMMSECRNKLTGIEHFEWHTAHLHKKKEMKYVAGDTFGPVVVRILPSLTGTDPWHYEHGFVGGMRAAEAYLWSKCGGYVGHFSAVANEER